MTRPKKAAKIGARKRRGRRTLYDMKCELEKRVCLRSEVPTSTTSEEAGQQVNRATDQSPSEAGNGNEAGAELPEGAEADAKQPTVEEADNDGKADEKTHDVEEPEKDDPYVEKAKSDCLLTGGSRSGSKNVGDVIDDRIEKSPKLMAELMVMVETSLHDGNGDNVIDLPEDSREVVPTVADEVVISD